LRQTVFEVLKQVIPNRSGHNLTSEQTSQKASSDLGRPGMAQWTILVLVVLRLGINTDYDRIHELANHHDMIRKMLGHGVWSDKKEYQLQTIKDNVCLFTP
jgi:transposase, IS5 family